MTGEFSIGQRLEVCKLNALKVKVRMGSFGYFKKSCLKK